MATLRMSLGVGDRFQEGTWGHPCARDSFSARGTGQSCPTLCEDPGPSQPGLSLQPSSGPRGGWTRQPLLLSGLEPFLRELGRSGGEVMEGGAPVTPWSCGGHMLGTESESRQETSACSPGARTETGTDRQVERQRQTETETGAVDSRLMMAWTLRSSWLGRTRWAARRRAVGRRAGRTHASSRTRRRAHRVMPPDCLGRGRGRCWATAESAREAGPHRPDAASPLRRRVPVRGLGAEAQRVLLRGLEAAGLSPDGPPDPESRPGPRAARGWLSRWPAVPQGCRLQGRPPAVSPPGCCLLPVLVPAAQRAAPARPSSPSSGCSSTSRTGGS
ncbi:FERM domain-containing protein 1 isoform X1 [Mustela putorius furo]|uniref:FERM domain-containing protein 1 isoform X1 n=1 Tax=Mustela putorius furo TaxID=9669 RepID=A0A8U0S410_MUSPF|nr:FERM domain-containing protein 1 isoform X1 [Mustela putorius furo]XP_044935960.1 FERM domain-containing protein 1 isoform X1 [Mustela putorius furo]XP_044935961.1 FERM domain-containing protein 1 isoform X1 [Mustela putorius furo]XP_044935962.1 FERM domain-containing protein 1 isoform X1 [Mustela putorius furo]XP_044935963.1 FERM domain-containing protein 1 isoform X1 [Mustela putorius furo]